MSVIWNYNPVGGLLAGVISIKEQFLEEVKTNSISKLINGVSKVLKNFFSVLAE